MILAILIQVGCHFHSFDWWLENGENVAREQKFSNDEIKEYQAYVELFVKIGK